MTRALLLPAFGLFGCQGGPLSGGGAPIMQPAINPTTTAGAGTALTWEGALVDVPATTTFVNGLDEEISSSRVEVGDFDANGIADIALSTTGGVEIWFGPIATGIIQVGGGDATITVPAGEDVEGVGDVDNDGDQDLIVGPWFVAVPSSGTVAAEDSALATITTYLGDSLTGAVFADVDLDGALDLVAPLGYGVRIIYGPLVGQITVPHASEPPDGASAILHTGEPDCVAGIASVLPDLDGNGMPELHLTTGMLPELDGCTDLPNSIWTLGDLRGQELPQTAALVTGLPSLAPVADIDGDGSPDFLGDQEIYRASDLMRDGAGAIPFASITVGEGSFYSNYAAPGLNPYLDLSGEGRREVVVTSITDLGEIEGLRVVEGGSVVGVIDPHTAGVPVGSGTDATLLGDFDGDGIQDLARSRASSTEVWSGAILSSLWTTANVP